jgi:hypothetical protein
MLLSFDHSCAALNISALKNSNGRCPLLQRYFSARVDDYAADIQSVATKPMVLQRGIF